MTLAASDSTWLKGKKLDKERLQNTFGLPVENVPLVTVINRLTVDKGLDIVLAALPEIFSLGAQVIIIGSGDTTIENSLASILYNYPTQFRLNAFNSARLEEIIRGADFQLMPYRVWPAIKDVRSLFHARGYGTIPIILQSNLWDNHMVDVSKDPTGTCFIFEKDTAESLLNAVKRATTLFRDPDAWTALQERATREYLV